MTVLVAVNGSRSSARAVLRAAELFDPSEVVLATVVPGERRTDDDDGSALRAATEQAAVDAAADLLSEARDLVGSRVRALLLDGDPVAALCDIARAEAVEAIVVGSLGTTALRRLVRPSIASDLAAEAPCPVIDLGSAPPP